MWWYKALSLEASVGMAGNNPYVGETVLLRLKVSHSEDGTVDSLGDGDYVSYEVRDESATVVASGSLNADAVGNGVWFVDYTLPEIEGVYDVVWTASIGGAVGRAKTSINVQGI